MQKFQEFLFLSSLKRLIEQLKYFAFAVLELNLMLKWVRTILSAVITFCGPWVLSQMSCPTGACYQEQMLGHSTGQRMQELQEQGDKEEMALSQGQ